MTLTVRAITPAQHSEWIATRPSVSFLQLPEWGGVKSGWRSESLGWFLGSRLVGAGLVLYRPVPRLPQRVLAELRLRRFMRTPSRVAKSALAGLVGS